MVFLHVAPPNVVSGRYGPQVNAWIYPLFEQNWRLFAPDPDSVNRTVSARTAHAGPDGAGAQGRPLDRPDRGGRLRHRAPPLSEPHRAEPAAPVLDVVRRAARERRRLALGPGRS
ncbi:DUF5819 family protein [Streptomyces albidoflavus]